VSGENGQFDILAEGKLIFSKEREGRFPEPEEVIGSLP
jgi:predicted Rdx family selenoprotein